MVTSNRVTDGFRNRVTLTFDLCVNVYQATAIEYTCTKFGVNSSRRSSSRFPVRAWTNRQTDATECYTHASSHAGVGNDK